jgi:hypothetical protein
MTSAVHAAREVGHGAPADRSGPAILCVDILGIGLLGPGLPDWTAGRGRLADPTTWSSAPVAIGAPARLAPTERRRAGAIVKCGIAVADQACAGADVDPSALATVFSSSSGDPANCHALCEALAAPERAVSPTRFTNSVHNASAGYWHIATASRAPSTSLCAFDASFGAGLLEAASQCASGRRPVLLVAADTPYPEPIHRARPLPDSFAIALVLSPAGSGAALAQLSLALEPGDPTPSAHTGLEALRRAIPAARALPLLEAVARGRVASVVVDFQHDLALRVEIAPGAGA